MSILRVSNKNAPFSTSAKDRLYSITVVAGTTLLVVSIGMEAGEVLAAAPKFGGVSLTLVHATPASGANTDMRMYTYGMINPTVQTANITFSTVTFTDNISGCAIGYSGTKTSSVADAIKLVQSVVNNTASITTIFATGGAAGNTNYIAACWQGGDGDPSTLNNFTTIFQGATGTANFDEAYHFADDIGLAPSAVTITWNVSEENAGHMLEIVPQGLIGTVHIKIGGAWKETETHIKVGGVWKQATPYVKVGGVWKELS